MFSLTEPPLFTRLRDAKRILIAGTGGGFDVYAGLPLALALRGMGKEVHLANLAFTDLTVLDIDDWLVPDVAVVGPDTNGSELYLPERVLARWLASVQTCRQPCTRSRAPECVCHAHVLENLAALDRDGGYLGALSIPSGSPEAEAYLDAVAHAQRTTPDRPQLPCPARNRPNA